MNGIIYATSWTTGVVEEDNKYFSSHVDLTGSLVIEGGIIELIGSYGRKSRYKVMAEDGETALLLLLVDKGIGGDVTL